MSRMTAAQKKVRAKRARRPVYMTARKMIDAETGEIVVAFRASNEIDGRLLRERGIKVGHEYRHEIKQAREGWKHRLMHKIGGLLVDSVEGWETFDSHGAIKEAQARSGVCCDSERFVIDLGQFGRHEVERSIPRSMAFDEMPEDEFERLFVGVTQWIAEQYSHVMLDDVRDEFWRMANREAA